MHEKNFLLLNSVICMIILYCIQFLIFPAFFDVSGVDFIFKFSTATFMFVAFITLHDRLGFWYLSDILYMILIFIYHPPAAYGIGTSIFALSSISSPVLDYRREDAWLVIFISVFVVMLYQFLTYCLFYIVKAFVAYRRKTPK